MKIKILIAMLIAIPVMAEETSHTTQHKAIQAEILKRCGIDIGIVQPNSDSWTSTGNGIGGPGLNVTCPTVKPYCLVWDQNPEGPGESYEVKILGNYSQVRIMVGGVWQPWSDYPAMLEGECK